jgi:hypothetical protein
MIEYSGTHDECDEHVYDLEMEIDDLQVKGSAYDDLYAEVETVIARLTREHDITHTAALQWCPETACVVRRSLTGVL